MADGALAHRRGWRWGLLALGLLLTLALRLHSWDEALEADEAVYLLIAEGWRQGLTPYVDLWDNKPILTFAIYRAGCALFGPVPAAAKFPALLAVLLGAGLLAGLLWRHGRLALGLGLVGLWPMLWVYPTAFANGANVEIFLATAMLVAWWLLAWPAAASPATPGVAPAASADPPAVLPRLLGAWSVLILACQIKLVMLPFLALPVALAAWHWRRRSAALAGVLAMLILLGWAWVWVVHGLAGYSAETLWHQLVYSSRHVSLHQESAPARLLRQGLSFPWAAPIAQLWPLTLAALATLVWRLARRQAGAWLDLAVVALTLAAILLPSSQNPHYYILWLPVLARLLPLGLAALAGWRPRWAGLAAALLLGTLAWHTWQGYLRLNMAELSRAKYGNSWFLWDRHVGQTLRLQGLGGGRIYADGSHPGAIFYAGALPATRNFVAWNLGLGALSPAEMSAQVMTAKPGLCLLFNPTPLTPELGDWLSQHYDELAPITGVRVFRQRAAPPGSD